MITLITRYAPKFQQHLLIGCLPIEAPVEILDEIWFGIIDKNPIHETLSQLIMVGIHK